MFDFESIQSSSILIGFIVSFAGALFWVTYSIQEFIIAYRKSVKSRSNRHRKELELFREELKKR